MTEKQWSYTLVSIIGRLQVTVEDAPTFSSAMYTRHKKELNSHHQLENWLVHTQIHSL